MAFWDSIFDAGAKLVGGYMSSQQQKDAQKAQLALAQNEYEHQKEFAQNGISWKVRDALAAGIHPLAALGASTQSYSTQAFNMPTESAMGKALAESGQSIGRAVNATMTSPQRNSAAAKAEEALTLERGQLENDLLRTKIASATAQLTQAGGNPAMPSPTRRKMIDGQGNTPDLPIGEKKKPGDRPKLYMGGQRVETNPNTSNAEEYEDRYGDDGPGSWLPQIGIMASDFVQNVNSGNLTREKFVQWVKDAAYWIDRNSDLGFGKTIRPGSRRKSQSLGGR